MSSSPEPARAPRLESIDLLRGIVMAVMALDHTRDFFHEGAMANNPTNLATTTPALFFTRWVTHFCAPTFVFLAGTGAYLYGSRGRSRRELSWFLVSRGLWLLVLELTVVKFGFSGGWDTRFFMLTTLWSLGWSMIVLGGLVFLPLAAIALFGVAMIAVHNAFDGVRGIGWFWSVLHEQSFLRVSDDLRIGVFYPLVPWIGVMAAGYAFGSIYRLDALRRRRILAALGLSLIAAFGLLRALNVYGDPRPWSNQPTALFTFLSFINCSKYPPSLLFLLMTLGPSIAFLAVADRGTPRVARWLLAYGRVPLVYYLLHLLLLQFLTQVVGLRSSPELSRTYLYWALVLAILYPVCRWYAGVKQRSPSPLLSYL